MRRFTQSGEEEPNGEFVLFDDVEKLQRDLIQYHKAFHHYHVSSNDGTDICKQCGLDLRNKIHFNFE
jgi:hypothetical protein